MRKLFFLTLLAGLLLQGCGLFKQEGNVKIYMKDAPLDLEQVEHIYITFSSIKAHRTGQGLETIFEGEKTVDLKALMEGEALIADVELEAGDYTQLRLVISEASLVIDGQTHQLEIPSGEVKIPCLFTVDETSTVTILLDFSAKDSIRVIEAGNSNRYILRPVIRVVSVTYS